MYNCRISFVRFYRASKLIVIYCIIQIEVNFGIAINLTRFSCDLNAASEIIQSKTRISCYLIIGVRIRHRDCIHGPIFHGHGQNFITCEGLE